MTQRQAAAVAAVVAVLVYANALLNGWAGDDMVIVAKNARVHGLGATLAAWRLPYWPPPLDTMGLYRPLTMLSYGVQWALSGGLPWMFHLTNILLHALATTLCVAIAGAWMAPIGALVAGLVFAVHPVHVEAVSNVVGQAELLAAVGLLGAVLAARRYRHAETPRQRRAWLAACVGLVAAGLLSKEHAAVAIAVLAVDQALDPLPARRPATGLYLAVAGLTLAWFVAWRAVAGGTIESGTTSAFFGLAPPQRWFTMLGAQLHVVRLLAWPLDLRPDYSPLSTITQEHWSGVVTAGVLVSGAIVALALTAARRAPAVTFGILVGAAAYAPTSNILFPSGVVLAERALYLAVLAPALAAGWLVTRSWPGPNRRAVVWACAFILAVFSVRTWTRTPFWKDPSTVIIEGALDHPENYRLRVHLGEFYESGRDTVRALAEFLAAAALYERDPFVTQFIVRDARALGRHQLALAEAMRAYRMAPDDWRFGRQLAETRLAAGLVKEAVDGAKADAARNPGSARHAETVTRLRPEPVHLPRERDGLPNVRRPANPPDGPFDSQPEP